MLEKIPINSKQKFQIGDICKMYDNEEVIILYTYSQMFGGGDYNSYCVYSKSSGGEMAWIQENQMDFIRKPNQEELDILFKEDKEDQYLPHRKSLLGQDDYEFLNREKIKRNQLCFYLPDYDGELHPQSQMNALGYKVIGAIPQSIADCWWFTVEEFIEPLPKYLSKMEYDFERWHHNDIKD